MRGALTATIIICCVLVLVLCLVVGLFLRYRTSAKLTRGSEGQLTSIPAASQPSSTVPAPLLGEISESRVPRELSSPQWLGPSRSRKLEFTGTPSTLPATDSCRTTPDLVSATPDIESAPRSALLQGEPASNSVARSIDFDPDGDGGLPNDAPNIAAEVEAELITASPSDPLPAVVAPEELDYSLNPDLRPAKDDFDDGHVPSSSSEAEAVQEITASGAATTSINASALAPTAAPPRAPLPVSAERSLSRSHHTLSRETIVRRVFSAFKETDDFANDLEAAKRTWYQRLWGDRSLETRVDYISLVCFMLGYAVASWRMLARLNWNPSDAFEPQ